MRLGLGLRAYTPTPSWLSPLFLCVGVSCPCRPPGLWEGVGGRERPPLLSPIPFCPFDLPLSRLTTCWSSPHLITWFFVFHTCVYVSGVWGGRSPPHVKNRWTQSRRDPAIIKLRQNKQARLPAGAPRTLSTCRHTTDLRQIRAFEEFQLPVVQFHSHLIPLGYFVVFGVSVDPCCPVQRRPACDGCVPTVRYRCPLTRMTCVCRVCCPCPRTGGGVRVRVTDRTTTTPVPGAL